MDKNRILGPLNAAQHTAVTTPPGSILVLAGAGSGKTRVLVHRIAWLLHSERVPPHSILVVTFTNKAATELKNRIENLLSEPIYGLWVGTFHGLAHRLLRIHWQEAKLPQSFQILDTDDQLRLLRRVQKAMKLDEKIWPAKESLWFINHKKDEGLRPQNLDSLQNKHQQGLIEIYTAYEKACQKTGLVDFAELLLRAHELLRDHQDLCLHYQQRFGHLLVDEFQDTNAIQYAWLRLLSGQQNKLFLVGDDDQSIYGWRGACVDNLRYFQHHYPQHCVLRLEQNYRSTQTILNAANALISQNSDRLGKALWTKGEQGAPLSLYAAFNEFEEARYTIERIRVWQSRGGLLSDVAILYRSNVQSRLFEQALISAQLPYRIYGGLRFFERAEIKDALAYLQLITHPNNDPAFERIVNTPPRGIGSRSLEVVRTHASQTGYSLWGSAKDLYQNGTSLSARARKSLGAFLFLIEKLGQLVNHSPLPELIETVLQDSGINAGYRKETGEKALMRLDNLQELVQAAADHMADISFQKESQQNTLVPPSTNSHPHKPISLTEIGVTEPWQCAVPVVSHLALGHESMPSSPEHINWRLAVLESFLAHAALESGEASAKNTHQGVQLMTFHAAKGLEFPVVFMAGLEEGLFPHSRCMENSAQLQEERRLCYVGITRAMQELHISHAEIRRIFQNEKQTKISRFLKEIPAKLIQEVRPQASFQRPLYVPKKPASPQDNHLPLGQRVRHQKFGEGVIVSREGHGQSERILVRFDKVGSKMLVTAFANLQAL